MSSGSGYTVTPMVHVNDDGSEQIIFDDANLVSNDNRQAVLEDFNNNQESYLTEDEEGELFINKLS